MLCSSTKDAMMMMMMMMMIHDSRFTNVSWQTVAT